MKFLFLIEFESQNIVSRTTTGFSTHAHQEPKLVALDRNHGGPVVIATTHACLLVRPVIASLNLVETEKTLAHREASCGIRCELSLGAGLVSIAEIGIEVHGEFKVAEVATPENGDATQATAAIEFPFAEDKFKNFCIARNACRRSLLHRGEVHGKSRSGHHRHEGDDSNA